MAVYVRFVISGNIGSAYLNSYEVHRILVTGTSIVCPKLQKIYGLFYSGGSLFLRRKMHIGDGVASGTVWISKGVFYVRDAQSINLTTKYSQL